MKAENDLMWERCLSTCNTKKSKRIRSNFIVTSSFVLWFFKTIIEHNHFHDEIELYKTMNHTFSYGKRTHHFIYVLYKWWNWARRINVIGRIDACKLPTNLVKNTVDYILKNKANCFSALRVSNSFFIVNNDEKKIGTLVPLIHVC